MNLTFWGAVGTVTGSLHEVGVNGSRYLLDCGLYQGRRKEARERNAQLPVSAGSIRAVILSHAHIDHSGNLPSLVKNGFSGPIYATPSTVDLCGAMLRDTAHIQEKDAAFVNKRRRKRGLEESENGGDVEPLYTMEDAENTIPLFEAVPYYTPTRLDDYLSYECFDAGHILGSSCVILHSKTGSGKPVSLAFSGDIGRPKLPIIRDPDQLPPADYVVMESTYGNRLHKDPDLVASKLADIIIRTARRGGKIIVPAFAVGRTQQLVLLLHELADAGRIPNIPVFVDSPLAIDVTKVFRAHPECFDPETRSYLEKGQDPFGFGRLQYVREASESVKLNDLHGPFVVISASGMCEAGRILHHLRNNVEDPRNTILITGFQAEHTLGRKLLEGEKEVAIFGEPMRVRAEVTKINELSGHADQNELLEWLRPLAEHVKRVFLVHGEQSQTEALKGAIEKRFNLSVTIPTRGQTFELN